MTKSRRQSTLRQRQQAGVHASWLLSVLTLPLFPATDNKANGNSPEARFLKANEEEPPVAEVDTIRALLVMALQDLAEGEAALIERLPAVADAVRDEDLRALIEQDRARSVAQQKRLCDILEEFGEKAGESENIWLRAILDDADHDAATIAAGPLRDIALTGALRKGKQSERVSYETALALARRMDLPGAAQHLQASRDEEEAADEALEAMLGRLVGTLAPS